MPTVAICHGTPQFVGQFDPNYTEEDLGVIDDDVRKEFVNLLQDVTVVCNSNQAAQEWGFLKSRVIWHGFSPHDFPPGLHDRKLLAMAERAIQNRVHYNGYFIFKEVQSQLQGLVEFAHLDTPDPQGLISGNNEWARAKFHNYTRELGRYSIYFNPTVRSPMPRTRGEAMMTGAVTVSLKNHDVDEFIDNEVNGFYASEPAELAEQIKFLIKNPSKLEKMGKASRLTALNIFNQDRYLADWFNLISGIL